MYAYIEIDLDIMCHAHVVNSFKTWETLIIILLLDLSFYTATSILVNFY